jgi:hypothetical protein
MAEDVWRAIACIMVELSQICAVAENVLIFTRVDSADPISPSCCIMPAENLFVCSPIDIKWMNIITLRCTETSYIHFPFTDPFNMDHFS